jgi:hypothetical protein
MPVRMGKEHYRVEPKPIWMMQEELIGLVAERRAREIKDEQPGTETEVEIRADIGRAVVHLSRGGTPIGVEFIETRDSINHPAVDKDYLRFLRDDLYMDILVPGSLPSSLERDLVVRLRALHDHAREEGYPSTRGVTVYGYDAEGNIMKKTTA